MYFPLNTAVYGPPQPPVTDNYIESSGSEVDSVGAVSIISNEDVRIGCVLAEIVCELPQLGLHWKLFR